MLAEEKDSEVREALEAAAVPEGDDPACADARKRLEKLQGRKKGGKSGGKRGGKPDAKSHDSGEPKAGDITPKLGGLD